MAKPTKVSLYGMDWEEAQSPLYREIYMVQHGGCFKKPNGRMAGKGLEFHFTQAIKLCWPQIVHHRWTEMFIKLYLTKRTVCVIGPASAGKSFMSAFCALMDYYCFSSTTTVICCSTTRERLEDRIWKEVKKLHRMAKANFSWLPGNLIESRQRIVTDNKDEASEGRDFGNGFVCVPVKRGENYVGLGDFAGIKNKRVILIGDELSLLPKAFVEAISNLDKNPKFLCIGLGNPKDVTDALGVLAEPSAKEGGWDGGIDQTPVSKVWEIRRPQGACLQLVGTDSPNKDGKLGADLITQEAIDRDVSFYGTDSLWYTMMNLGQMPRGQGSRRVITRQMCEKFHAKDAPVWLNSNRTRIASMDAAYRGVGGDRCILAFSEFGEEMPSAEDVPQRIITALATGPIPENKKRFVFALNETMIVPIKNGPGLLPEDQIVSFVMAECAKRNIGPENLFFDAGMKTSLVTAFSRLWSPKVNSIDFGGKASERKVSHDIDVVCRDYYQKFVTELWYSVRLLIESGQFRGMTEDVMMEFASREWTTVSSNKIEVEPKEKMKAKTGRSPDLADAVACAVEGARRLGLVIRRLQSETDALIDDGWKSRLRDKAGKYWQSGQLSYN